MCCSAWYVSLRGSAALNATYFCMLLFHFVSISFDYNLHIISSVVCMVCSFYLVVPIVPLLVPTNSPAGLYVNVTIFTYPSMIPHQTVHVTA